MVATTGPVPYLQALDLSELREFGAAADKLHRHGVGVSGEIIPHRDPRMKIRGGKESSEHEQGQRAGPEEARSPAGAREGQGPSSAGGSAAAQAVQRQLVVARGLEELLGYYPGWTWSSSPSGVGYLRLPVYPFCTLPYSGVLTLELPTQHPSWLTSPSTRQSDVRAAPHVRSWATWEYGIPITSHHEYPDRSMCTHMPGDWDLRTGQLLHLAAMAVLWIGKSLHNQLLGRWPGQQHYESAHVRLHRDAVDEYCGCGSDQPYGSCCRAVDLATRVYERLWWLCEAERRYLHEIQRRGWPRYLT
jgi:hypothetical protein